MMSSQSQSALVLIVVAFAVLMLIVGTVFVLGSRRRRRSQGLATQEKEKGPLPYAPQPIEEEPEAVKAPAVGGEAPGGAPAVGAVEAPPVVATGVAPAVTDEFASSTTLSKALQKTEQNFFGRLKGLFQNPSSQQNLDEIEEVLYTSDLGPQTVVQLMDKLSDLKSSQRSDLSSLKSILKDEFLSIFNSAQIPEPDPTHALAHLENNGSPVVWMIVGVNGAGKTTTIGKLSAHLAREGKKVLVAAGDTFRAAAGSQLKVWTDRAQVEFFSPNGVIDPSAVAFEALTKAKSQGFDIVLVDTAGRLHTQVNLMEELKKVKRVMAKVVPEAPHETLIVLDANSGQNALQQAREFNQALSLTGVVLTKMDGTAKGGVAVGLAHELKIPIRLIGIGEKIGDLKPFSANEFVDSILGGK